jgi:succinate-semialdehyde dehydrogenase/glutarate-semialdehyde dehydrogenase
MSFISVNPATGKMIKEFKEESIEDVKKKIDNAHQEFLEWKDVSFFHRRKLMLNAAEVLRSSADKYGRIMTEEMGKPITQSKAEIEKCAWVCAYYADTAANMLEVTNIKIDASDSYVRYDPLGVILGIMPWNFPFWQVFRFAVPTIMAGNAAVLKHASNVPQCSLAIEEVFRKAGFPENLFQSLLIGSSVMEQVIARPYIQAVSLTGSEEAGKSAAQTAGKYLKKCVLELGGSDPFIVFADADLEQAAENAVKSRMQNTGQSCIAAKRFILVKEIADKFIDLFIAKIKGLKVGDPLDEATAIGPIAREDLLNDIQKQVDKSVEMGAKVLLGGERIEREGSYYEPTVISNLKKGMPVYDEEVFGPVASVIIAQDEEDAIRLGNDTPYGLGANLWTKDLNKARSLACRIEAGSVFVNGMVKSDPRLPFGGVKLSGYGRELSHFGIKEFVNVKTVWVA